MIHILGKSLYSGSVFPTIIGDCVPTQNDEDDGLSILLRDGSGMEIIHICNFNPTVCSAKVITGPLTLHAPLRFRIVDIDGSPGLTATVQCANVTINMDLDVFKRHQIVLKGTGNDAYQYEFSLGYEIHFA